MSLQLVFWMIMIVWAIFGFWTSPRDRGIQGFGGTILEFALFAIIGWQVFGAAIHR